MLVNLEKVKALAERIVKLHVDGTFTLVGFGSADKAIDTYMNTFDQIETGHTQGLSEETVLDLIQKAFRLKQGGVILDLIKEICKYRPSKFEYWFGIMDSQLTKAETPPNFMNIPDSYAGMYEKYSTERLRSMARLASGSLLSFSYGKITRAKALEKLFRIMHRDPSLIEEIVVGTLLESEFEKIKALPVGQRYAAYRVAIVNMIKFTSPQKYKESLLVKEETVKPTETKYSEPTELFIKLTGTGHLTKSVMKIESAVQAKSYWNDIISNNGSREVPVAVQQLLTLVHHADCYQEDLLKSVTSKELFTALKAARPVERGFMLEGYLTLLLSNEKPTVKSVKPAPVETKPETDKAEVDMDAYWGAVLEELNSPIISPILLKERLADFYVAYNKHPSDTSEKIRNLFAATVADTDGVKYKALHKGMLSAMMGLVDLLEFKHTPVAQPTEPTDHNKVVEEVIDIVKEIRDMASKPIAYQNSWADVITDKIVDIIKDTNKGDHGAGWTPTEADLLVTSGKPLGGYNYQGMDMDLLSMYVCPIHGHVGMTPRSTLPENGYVYGIPECDQAFDESGFIHRSLSELALSGQVKYNPHHAEDTIENSFVATVIHLKDNHQKLGDFLYWAIDDKFENAQRLKKIFNDHHVEMMGNLKLDTICFIRKVIDSKLVSTPMFPKAKQPAPVPPVLDYVTTTDTLMQTDGSRFMITRNGNTDQTTVIFLTRDNVVPLTIVDEKFSADEASFLTNTIHTNLSNGNGSFHSISKLVEGIKSAR